MQTYEILPLILRASPFVWATMLILIACSLWTWYLFTYKFVETKRALASCKRFSGYYDKSQHKAEIYRQLAPRLARLDDLERLYVQITSEFRKMYSAHPGRIEFVIHHLERRTDHFINERIDALSSNCLSLATIATTAPFIGLLGTVWGVIDVFTSLGQASQINLATIAPGISETLVATALGLVTAIPAAVAYNWVVRRVSGISAEHERFAAKLVSELSQVDVARPGQPAR